MLSIETLTRPVSRFACPITPVSCERKKEEKRTHDEEDDESVAVDRFEDGGGRGALVGCRSPRVDEEVGEKEGRVERCDPDHVGKVRLSDDTQRGLFLPFALVPTMRRETVHPENLRM